MKNQGKVRHDGKSISELLDQQYLEANNRPEIDYWDPLARIIMEVIESRHIQGVSQADLASLMKTKQSVISRFENMGRKPNYDFIARLSIALGHAPGMTLYGEYMAVVSQDKHESVKRMAADEGVPTQKFVEQLLEHAIVTREAEEYLLTNILNTTVEFQSSTVDTIGALGDTADTTVWLSIKPDREQKAGSYYLPQQLRADEGADEAVCGHGSQASTIADRLTA